MAKAKTNFVVPDDLEKHLVVHGFSDADCKAARSQFEKSGYWKSPRGSQWGDPEPVVVSSPSPQPVSAL